MKLRGFTLIELLVVIGILAILLTITLIAINPARQFGLANDTKRRSDENTLLNAIGQYQASNSGNLPSDISGLTVNTIKMINSTNTPNLCGQLVPNYVPALPTDPTLNNQAGIATCSGSWNTDYQISRDANNRVTLYAPSAYLGPIQITR